MGLMAIRAVIIYVILFIVVRLMGKREIGEMQPFELVITLVVADLACVPMNEISVPLGNGLIPIFTLLVVHFLLCFISRKSLKARYLISGRPVIVINPKGIDYKALKKLNMTIDDLIESIRFCGAFSVDDVSYAIIETNGKMCCILNKDESPVSKKDLKIKTTPSALPVNIIIDGKILKENLAICDIKEDFVAKILKKANINAVKDVLLLTLDNNGKVFIQSKNKETFKTFKVDFNKGDRW